MKALFACVNFCLCLALFPVMTFAQSESCRGSVGASDLKLQSARSLAQFLLKTPLTVRDINDHVEFFRPLAIVDITSEIYNFSRAVSKYPSNLSGILGDTSQAYAGLKDFVLGESDTTSVKSFLVMSTAQNFIKYNPKAGMLDENGRSGRAVTIEKLSLRFECSSDDWCRDNLLMFTKRTLANYAHLLSSPIEDRQSLTFDVSPQVTPETLAEILLTVAQ